MDVFLLVARIVAQLVAAILESVQSGDDILKKRLKDLLPDPLLSEVAQAQARIRAEQKFGASRS
jgi:hypothetical protein